MIESMKEERKQDEQNHRKAIEDLRKSVENERTSKDHALEELRKKNYSDLAQLREKLSVEKEEWQSHYMKKIESDIRAKEKQFKDKLIKERDAEIEMVIQRLESETNSNTSDATRKFRMDVEKIKAEAAEEMKHLRDQHSMALDKVLAGQSAINQLEEHRRQLQKELLQAQHEIASKESQVRQQKHELTRLKVDEQTLAQIIRREFQEQIGAKDDAIHGLQDQIATLQDQTEVLRRKYQAELDGFKKDKEGAIFQIEEKVKQALKQKDDIISTLKNEYDDLMIRSNHLEALIDKQRHELLN